jgi:hypothetical protein
MVFSSSGGTERARIDSSGNVGIGTSSPTSRLHVDQGADGNGITLAYAGRGASRINWDMSGVTNEATSLFHNNGTNKFLMQQWSRDYLAFSTNNTERARIDSSGNLLVGTTSGSRKLQVKGPIAFEQISGGTNVWEAYHFTDNTYRLNYNGAGGDEFILYTNGNYAFSGSNVSDERLKQDIEPEAPQLANVLTLAPKTYRFKPRETQNGSGEVSGIKHGFIAQEVLQLMPELVSGDPTNADEILGVDYNGIVALCVKAIQEQQAIINDLKARLDAANL